MDKWFKFSTDGMLAIALSGIGIYVSIIILTRIMGKRSFSKMSSFDFAITVALGSMVATTVLSKSVSLWDGMVGITMLYVLQLGMAYLRRFSMVSKVTDNTPLLLMKGKQILHDNLKKARVTESDLKAKLREANVLDLSQVRAVVFETTGDIAVLHTNEPGKQIQTYILEGVNEE